MTKKEIISLSLKLAGIYCLIMAITHLNFAIMYAASALRGQSFWSMLISIGPFLLLLLSLTPPVLLLLFGVYLIFSDKLPSRMASSIIIQEEEATSFTFQDIQMLAFSIIGVWLLSSTIPTFIQVIVRITVLHSSSQQAVYVYFIPQIVVPVLKLALGIYLFLGGKGLAKLWQKCQSTTDIKPSN